MIFLYKILYVLLSIKYLNIKSNFAHLSLSLNKYNINLYKYLKSQLLNNSNINLVSVNNSINESLDLSLYQILFNS